MLSRYTQKAVFESEDISEIATGRSSICVKQKSPKLAIDSETSEYE
jgi:hypothetical protein